MPYQCLPTFFLARSTHFQLIARLPFVFSDLSITKTSLVEKQREGLEQRDLLPWSDIWTRTKWKRHTFCLQRKGEKRIKRAVSLQWNLRILTCFKQFEFWVRACGTTEKCGLNVQDSCDVMSNFSINEKGKKCKYKNINKWIKHLKISLFFVFYFTRTSITLPFARCWPRGTQCRHSTCSFMQERLAKPFNLETTRVKWAVLAQRGCLCPGASGIEWTANESFRVNWQWCELFWNHCKSQLHETESKGLARLLQDQSVDCTYLYMQSEN